MSLDFLSRLEKNNILHRDISFSELIILLNKKLASDANSTVNYFSFDGFIKGFSTVRTC